MGLESASESSPSDLAYRLIAAPPGRVRAATNTFVSKTTFTTEGNRRRSSSLRIARSLAWRLQ